MTRHITIDISKYRPGSIISFYDAWEESKHPRGQSKNKGQFVKAGTASSGAPQLHTQYSKHAALNKVQNLGTHKKLTTQEKIDQIKAFQSKFGPTSWLHQHAADWLSHLKGGAPSTSAPAVKPLNTPAPTPKPVATSGQTPYPPDNDYETTMIYQAATDPDTTPEEKLKKLSNVIKGSVFSAKSKEYATKWVSSLEVKGKPTEKDDDLTNFKLNPVDESGYKPAVNPDTGMSVQAAMYLANNAAYGTPAKLKAAYDTLTKAGAHIGTAEQKAAHEKLASFIANKLTTPKPIPSAPSYTPTPKAAEAIATKGPLKYDPGPLASPDMNVPLALPHNLSSNNHESIDKQFIELSGMAPSLTAYANQLGKDTRTALQSYSGSVYKSINKKFRDGKTFSEHEQEVVDGIDDYLESEKSRMPRDVRVFRGTDMPSHQIEAIEEALKNGKTATVYNSGYNSTSLNKDKSWAFGQHRFAITVKRGVHAAYMNSCCSSHKSEYELLVRRGTRMRVTGKVVVDGQTVYNAVLEAKQ